jgi:hypothetical protein
VVEGGAVVLDGAADDEQPATARTPMSATAGRVRIRVTVDDGGGGMRTPARDRACLGGRR